LNDLIAVLTALIIAALQINNWLKIHRVGKEVVNDMVKDLEVTQMVAQKLEVVHNVVNGQKEALLVEIIQLKAEVVQLKGEVAMFKLQGKGQQ
jgi:hypothetical protein